MAGLLFILVFIAFYGLSISGGKNAKFFFVTGFLLNVGYVIYRGAFLGRMPVTERHDILMAMGALVAASFFYFRHKVNPLILYPVLPLFVVTLCFFSLFQEKMDTIEPNMNTGWFYLHMALFVSGYALLTAGSAAGIFHFAEKRPSLEIIQYQLTLLGWLLFSCSLIAGSVWFFRAYGVYWLWTAKELWTTITWLYYTVYLHGRRMQALRGMPSSLIGATGFGFILFSYLGVTPILGSPWTQF